MVWEQAGGESVSQYLVFDCFGSSVTGFTPASLMVDMDALYAAGAGVFPGVWLSWAAHEAFPTPLSPGSRPHTLPPSESGYAAMPLYVGTQRLTSRTNA